MDWSKEEQVVLGELKKMPDLSMGSQKRYEVYQAVEQGAWRMKKSRKRNVMIGSLAGVAAVAVLTLGLLNQGIVSDLLNNQPIKVSGAPNQAKVGFEFQINDPSGQMTEQQKRDLLRVLEIRLDSMGLPHSITINYDKNLIRIVPELTKMKPEPKNTQWTAEQQQQFKQAVMEPPKLEVKAPDGTVLAQGREFIDDAYVEKRDYYSEVVTKFHDPQTLNAQLKPLVGQEISIWLDGRKLKDIMVVNEFGDSAVISGRLDHDQAESFAQYLRGSILPYTLQEKTTQ